MVKKNNISLKSEEIDRRELFKKVWKDKILILSISLAFVIISSTNIYFKKPELQEAKVNVLLISKNEIDLNYLFPSFDLSEEYSREKFYFIDKFNRNQIFKIKFLSKQDLNEYLKENNEFNEFKFYLKDKKINQSEYFIQRLQFIYSEKTKDNIGDVLSLSYEEPLDGLKFLNNYIFFITKKVEEEYKKFLEDLIIYKIKILNINLDLAEKANIKYPLEKYNNLYGKGTILLSEKILNLQNILSNTKNFKLYYDYSEAWVELSSTRNGPSKYTSLLTSLLSGIVFSFFLIFFKNMPKNT